MSTLFARLFNPRSTSADGFTQSQREAVIDLLNFCTYADDRLTLAEDRLISDQLNQCQWDPAVPLELFVSRSITRARNALESPERRAAFLADVAERIKGSEVRTRVVALCKLLFQVDGHVAPDEASALKEIEKALG